MEKMLTQTDERRKGLRRGREKGKEYHGFLNSTCRGLVMLLEGL